MSLQFYNIIIPIKNIEKCKRIGGFKGYIDNYINKEVIGKVFWWDKYLFRDGAMSWDDVEYSLDFWIKQG